MSRSFKKTPGHKDRNIFMKTYHQRKLRRYLNNLDNEVSPKGQQFRKLQDIWDWCDWKCLYYTPEELRLSRERWTRTCKEHGWDIDPDPLYKYYMK